MTAVVPASELNPEPPLILDVWPRPGRCPRRLAPPLQALLWLTAMLRRLDLAERIEFRLARMLGIPPEGEPRPFDPGRPWTEQEDRYCECWWTSPAWREHERRIDIAKWSRWWVRECIRNGLSHGERS